MPNATETTNSQILALLFHSEKAWRKGGGMGASSGLGGSGGGKGGVSKPGSRGGHPWTDDKGNVRYGPQPKGSSGGAGGKKPQAVARTMNKKPGQGKPNPMSKPKTPLTKLQQQHRMLSEMDRAIKLGKDPHGNKLSPKAQEQLKVLAIQLRTQLGGAVKKEIAEKAADRLPFTVFKDKQGQWRWIGIASSAAQDHDGETVSLKALSEDVANKDATGTHGPLNWWHTSIKLGTCDFNAMDGPLLVESGTFVNSQVAAAVSKAISDGVFKPAMSLEFEHNEPGPPVLPGRVFQKINKVGRALLPAEKASNLLTNFQVYSLNSALAGKEVKDKDNKKMIPEEKLKLLERTLPKDLLDGLLSGNEIAIKSAELAGLSFKAAAPAVVEAPAPAPIEVAPVVVAPPLPEPAPVVNEVAAPAPVEEAVGEEEGEAVDAAALFEGLTQSITNGVLAGIAAQQATSTKETSEVLTANTIAMKEVATALATVQAENVSLKARLDALEGNQPPAVRARASQGLGIKEADLPPSIQELVKSDKETPRDPYAESAARLVPIYPGLIPNPARG